MGRLSQSRTLPCAGVHDSSCSEYACGTYGPHVAPVIVSIIFSSWTSLSTFYPGDSLRGIQLYLSRKHGVFRNMESRHYGPGNTIPASPVFSELELSDEEIAEIDDRFEALKPYQKPGSPDL